MAKDLIIVESPAKVKTIKKFLGEKFYVEASVGHVRDLPQKKLGVDESKGFEPQYGVIPGKQKVVDQLQKVAAKAGTVFLAPDPDREGEAIAWHMAELLKETNPNIERIQFNEITAKAVREALEHPREINEKLFQSQQARRILDRLVGYKISPLLWRKVRKGISAGRVQSVALRIVVDREKERLAFKPEEYWLFKARLEGDAPPPFEADLAKIGGKKAHVGSADAAQALDAELNGKPFVVREVAEKERSKQPPAPFITSTLQQAANQRLGYAAKKTMGAAQKLYEGVDLGERGTTALITYMRTDSTRIADEARDAAKAYIVDTLGKEYYPAKARVFKTKAGAQDAHEAIRPIDVAITPRDVAGLLPKDQYQVYKLVWERFVASQMAAARFWDTSAAIECGPAEFKAKGERLIFPGFLKVYGQDAEDESGASKALPPLAKGQELKLLELKREQKFTQPPPRYTEASLVRELEEKGIGRPSTYAAIISTLLDRDYARLEEKHFAPTELGVTVSDQLTAHFQTVMDVGFTAGMEEALDQVAEGGKDWRALLTEFASGFNADLDKASKDMANEDTGLACPECGKALKAKFGRSGPFLACAGYPECKFTSNFTKDETGAYQLAEKIANADSGLVCPSCGKPMLVKFGKRGPFLACAGYPDCSTTANFTRDESGKYQFVETPEQMVPEVVGSCPECGKDVLLKKTRTGSRFYSCSGYPKCKYSKPFTTGVACPREGCNGELVEKSSRYGKLFYSCSNYPNCDMAVWDWPVVEPCPQCASPILVKKTTKTHGEHLACPVKTCKYRKLQQ
ncbi:type I DNA topoisomerase [Fundidesulfovibrio soli]|uniref:type I DNA topoisomerase n=1 Tax=Fundidesulfovibrio soli TaxID=2922716 RepID=UPI001FAFEA7C|nr:type I DNA topoisomerase [Fundidesulfovibrio soli]